MSDFCIANGQSGGCGTGNCGSEGNTCLSYACVPGYTGGVPIPGQNGVCALNGSWSSQTNAPIGESQYDINGQFMEASGFDNYFPIVFGLDNQACVAAENAWNGLEFKLTGVAFHSANIKGFRFIDLDYPETYENIVFGDFGTIPLGSSSQVFGGQTDRLGFSNFDGTNGVFYQTSNPVFQILVDSPSLSGFWELEYFTGYQFSGGSVWTCTGPQSP